MKTKSIILLSLLLFCIETLAQIPIVRNFTMVDYFGGTRNWKIGQSGDGKMFFANSLGLLEYDGDIWKNYPIQNKSIVYSLYFDEAKDAIYIGGTNEFGFYRPHPQTHKLTYSSVSSLLPTTQRSFGDVRNVHEYEGEKIFVTPTYIFHQRKDGYVGTIRLPYQVDMSSVVYNQLVICCKENIFRYKNGRLIPLPGLEELKGKVVQAVLPLFNKMLFVTEYDGLYLYDGKTLSPYILDITPQLMASDINCATVSDNYLAFGTYRDGLIVKDYLTGKTYFSNTMTGLQNNIVLAVEFDKDRNLWLGLDNGISYVMLETPFFDLLGKNNTVGTGYTSLISGDNLYLGTNQGLYRTNSSRANINGHDAPVAINNISGQIWSLTNIDGHTLCGAAKGGYIIKGDNAQRIDTVETYKFKPLKNHPGYILSTDAEGFKVLKSTPQGVTIVNRIKGFTEVGGRFEEDTDGTIWVTNWQKGIYHLWMSHDMTQFSKIEYFHRKNGLPQDDNNLITKIKGHIYITSVDGFRHYNKVTGKLEKDETMNRIFNIKGQALNITEMPSGKLWIYKENYLAIATPIKNSYAIQQFLYGNLVKRLQMTSGTIGVLNDDYTMLNYDGGFFVVYNGYKSKPIDCPFYIRSVFSTAGDKDSLIYAHSIGNKDKEISIPHSLGSLRIEFVMPEYRDSKAVTYSCFLEGYDDKWTVPQAITNKEYTQLNKGHYTFRVRAHNLISGKEKEISIELHIEPAWYETWFAIFIYVVLAIGASFWILRYAHEWSNRRLIRLNEEKERQLKQQQAEFLIEEQKREKELVKLRNEQLTLELKHKSGELADSTMNLVRKNDMLQAIDKQMEMLSEGVRREEPKTVLTKKINDIRCEIKSNMTEDDNWEKFQENFNLVYDNFMQKLRTQFPDLKKNDLKLCAYLRMGLSSKEMASLLNSSVRSIETARYRLRKKLELDSGENLTNFIQNLDDKQPEE